MKSNDQLRSEFDQAALKLAETGPTSAAQVQTNIHFLTSNLPAQLDQALDIGCGLGDYARLLASRCQHILALDLSPEMIRIARERSGEYPNIEYQVADATTWDFPRERFDCIFSINTLHHMSLEPILTRIKAALRPGGVLLVLDLYRPSGLRYALEKALNIARRRIFRLSHRKNKSSVRGVWNFDPKESKLNIKEIREIYHAVLPGTQLTERINRKRYSAVWAKPDL